MSIAPFPIPVLRDSMWSVLQSDELLPGDVISLGTCFVFIMRFTMRSDPIQRAATSQKRISPRTYSWFKGHALLMRRCCLASQLRYLKNL
jgi:hypothetical protein